ncbi:pentapeptide repeat-containing protein [Streptomyces djakartensis]|uniref:Pentapeptide repeat-containing protein n=1 Tax=Streptomyces djakartensis TaxID=68193 RepID=A0ABQ3A6M9_9ACTN|nr:pentapeptide repeat-containing protein [Streptomyces djakartensis]GGY34965.1 hypothetical protein GCM10010384_47510 [Streptomyces djakartensis]
MATTPPRRSGRTARLQRVARRQTRTVPRRAAAPIGSRPPGRRHRTRTGPPPPAAQQPAVLAPTDLWTRIQQAAGTIAALGTLAVIVFTWLSLQQVDNEQALTRNEHALTREGQVTDRYNNAVGNIGDDSLEVRLGGIYALQRIMEDSPRDQPSIVNVLSTYIRNHAKKPRQAADASNREPASDVQAALTALGSRNRAHDGSANVDLHDTYLFGVNLQGANLHGANLMGADLICVNLADTNLYGAKLNGAKLHGAYLADTNLNGVNLNGAKLNGAKLFGDNVTDASPFDADLCDAKR